jgi:hypothetical protein
LRRFLAIVAVFVSVVEPVAGLSTQQHLSDIIDHEHLCLLSLLIENWRRLFAREPENIHQSPGLGWRLRRGTAKANLCFDKIQSIATDIGEWVVVNFRFRFFVRRGLLTFLRPLGQDEKIGGHN